jgi:Homeodomain-like domain
VQLDVMAMHSQAMAKPLHQLSPHHHQAVALRLAGERPQAIAQTLGVERRTVYLWFSDPLVKDELERRSRDLAKLITERLADHTLAALSRLREIIELPVSPESLTPAQKLEVIREILDRCAYTVKLPPGTPNRSWIGMRGGGSG